MRRYARKMAKRKNFNRKIKERDLVFAKKQSGTVLHVYGTGQSFAVDVVCGGVETWTKDELIEGN